MSLRLGFSPFPYYITPEGLRPDLAPPLDEILQRIAAEGYVGVPAEVPAGMAAGDYVALLAKHGLTPAPGYFQADFADVSAREATVASAQAAAREHAALGLDRIFLAQRFPDMERFAAPGAGLNANRETLEQIVETIAAAADAMVAEGVVPCLHQHIGSRIETEEETRFVLDALPADRLLFGPDIGHLTWAGADPVAILRDYRDRIGVAHLKDIRLSIARDGRAQGHSYRQIGWNGLWTVPGSGDIAYEAVLAVLRGLDIWIIAEIDIPDGPTVEDVAQRAFAWLSPRLEHAVAEQGA